MEQGIAGTGVLAIAVEEALLVVGELVVALATAGAAQVEERTFQM